MSWTTSVSREKQEKKGFVFKIKKKSTTALTNYDESGGLEELLIIPSGMFCLQNVTHSVVLPQPQGGVHGETRHDSKKLLTNGQTMLWRESVGIHHVHRHIRHGGGINLSIHYLNRIYIYIYA